MTLVLRSDADGVATLTLNRPDKLNALTPGTFHELRAHLDAIDTDASVRCVVLTGAGRSFCAGNDLDAIAAGVGEPSESSSERTRQRSRDEPMLGPETVDALEQVSQPTIAKIRGHCFTGGLELALACDFLVAAASTTFGDTHGQWGMVPIWGMSIRLPERVGLANAKDLMFTARRIDAARALEIGLVDRCVADDELDTAVDTLAAEVVANSPGTNRIVKRLLRERSERPRPEALQWERSRPHGMPDDMAERLARGRPARR